MTVTCLRLAQKTREQQGTEWCRTVEEHCSDTALTMIRIDVPEAAAAAATAHGHYIAIVRGQVECAGFCSFFARSATGASQDSQDALGESTQWRNMLLQQMCVFANIHTGRVQLRKDRIIRDISHQTGNECRLRGLRRNMSAACAFRRRSSESTVRMLPEPWDQKTRSAEMVAVSDSRSHACRLLGFYTTDRVAFVCVFSSFFHCFLRIVIAVRYLKTRLRLQDERASQAHFHPARCWRSPHELNPY